MKAYEKILKSLANHRRLEIIKFIKSKGQATVGSIATHIKLSFKSTSKHLVILYNAGILEKDQKDLSVLYSLNRTLSNLAKQVIDQI